MLYEWIQTTKEVYRSIYSRHKGHFSVFESYTENCEETEKLKRQITAWGFNDSEHPIIKSEMQNYNEWKYYLLHKCEQPTVSGQIEHVVSCDELKVICDTVVELTRIRQKGCGHLCVENFAQQCLGQLLAELQLNKEGKLRIFTQNLFLI